MLRTRAAFAPLLLVPMFLHSLPAGAVDGKWTPQQVPQLDAAWLSGLGLELPAARLWDNATGKGLLAATLQVGGCSGGFVSADGIFVTNHHCLFAALQEHSTPDRDLITDGFLARRPDAELGSKTLRATVPRRFTDVAPRLLAAVPAGASDLERWRAIDRETKAIVAECERQPATRCKVAAHDGGVAYVLQEMTEFDDVRLVYAPPRAVGEYGGEIDNWMWPRHTGDIAVGRIWVNGAPYRPAFHFPIGGGDLDAGTFVMIPGYPGTTFRALTAAEMEERRQFFALRAEIFAQWIRILDAASATSPEAAIAVAADLKTMHNRQKNAEGQLAGLARGKILAKQADADAAVLAWAREHAAEGAVAAHATLAAMAQEQRQRLNNDFLLDNVRMAEGTTPLGPKALVLGVAVARGARERAKPDVERDALFMERNLVRTADRLEREQKNLAPAAEQALLVDWLRRARELPAVAATLGTVSDAELPQRVASLYAGSQLLDATARKAMWSESADALAARHDPLLDLAIAVAADVDVFLARKEGWEATVSRYRPEWRRAVIAHAGKPVAPDANSTLRVTFATVQGYAPRDGLVATPQTTLGGALAKHTGEEPFAVPAKVREAAARGTAERWRDPELNDVPIAFLADGDTTGGNSGSPVLDGRGALVGINFDRVWENVANDFGFNPEVARNISVDVRYLLWLLAEVEGATELLQALGVDPAAASPAR